MNIGLKGLELVKSFESLRLYPYLDAVGIPTIGYGHTANVFMDSGYITEDEAERFLKEDLAEAEKGVNRLVRVELTQNQFDALVSFTFNVGVGNLEISRLLKKVNQRDFVGVAEQFSKWVYARKKRLAGLERRRQAEAELFLS